MYAGANIIFHVFHFYCKNVNASITGSKKKLKVHFYFDFYIAEKRFKFSIRDLLLQSFTIVYNTFVYRCFVVRTY